MELLQIILLKKYNIHMEKVSLDDSKYLSTKTNSEY